MRPSLRLDGQPAPLLDSDLIEATVIARADGVRCAVALANWGDVGGTSGFLHFDGALEPGRALAVTLAEGLVFAGVIDAIEARYPGDAPSTLLLEAAGMLADMPDGTPPRLALGAHLRACSVRWTQAGLRGDQSTTAEGTADFDARIRAGAAIALNGLGGSNDGAYDVVEARHRYDGAGGLRSDFVAIRRAWLA